MWWEITESRTMRILVCGGRDFTNWVLLNRTLHHTVYDGDHTDYSKQVIIHGKDKGADTLAGQWADINNVPVLEYPADWAKYQHRAGPIRNQRMIDEGKPDLVVAFPTPKFKGTWDMIRRAEKAGIETIVVKHEQNS